MSYYIAEFQRDGKNEIAIVHRNWMFGDKCYWPKFWRNSNKLNHAITSGMQPDDKNWGLHKARIVGNMLFDTYDLARAKLAKAEFGSELSSEEPVHQDRKRRSRNKQNQHSDAGSDDSDEDPVSKKKGKHAKSSVTVLPSPPLFPYMKEQLRDLNQPTFGAPSLVAVSYDNFVNNQIEPHSITPLTATTDDRCTMPNPMSVTHSNTVSLPNISPLLDSNSTVFRQPTMYQQTKGQAYSESPCGTYTTENGIHTSNLRSLTSTVTTLQHGQAMIAMKMDIALDMLRTLVQGQGGTMEEPTTDLVLPINTKEGFDKMNLKLTRDRKLQKSLSLMLAAKGGQNPNQITYRIMQTLMTDSLMLEFTMAGRKEGKLGFKESVFMQIICDAVRLNKKGSIATHKEIEAAVEYWLKKAKTRIEATNKRNEKLASQLTQNSDRSDQED